jgi:putative transposase
MTVSVPDYVNNFTTLSKEGVRRVSDTRLTPHVKTAIPASMDIATIALRETTETGFSNESCLTNARSELAPSRRMPRRPRLFVPGLSLHVIKRGINRTIVCQRKADYEVLLELLRRALGCHAVSLHAYALMNNHFHLLVTPEETNALPRFMKEVNGAYTRYFNSQYQRMGTLWNGRYRAIAIGDERYWMTCLRYVELNPVRAGIVGNADAYAWSSYAAHAHGRRPGWLTPHPLYQALGRTDGERQAAYRSICGTPLPEDHVQFLRSESICVTSGSDRCQTPV